jgi:alpha-L-arabinofuranosidase
MRVVLLGSLVALGTAPGIQAQQACIEQIEFPAVGRWAEYRAVFKQMDPYTIRYAVIGAETRGGKSLKWLELRTTGNEKDGDFVYQMLVPGSASQLGDVQEIVMKHGTKPAMKMDGMMLKMISGQMEKQSFLSEICKEVSLVGAEAVTVPAGKFETWRFHSAKYSSDSWITAGVPFSMVKAIGRDYEFALTGHGDGAKSSIVEKPQSMGGESKR